MADKTQVRGPDGRIIRFPAEMSHDEINVEMSKIYGAKSEPQTTQKEISTQAMQGAGDAVTDSGFVSKIPVVGGALDNIMNRMGPEGRGRAVSGALGVGQGATFGFMDEGIGLVNPDIKEGLRAANKASSDANPVAHAGGEIVGGLATGGTSLAKMGAIKGGAVAGGVYGAGTAEGGIVDRADETAKGAALGAVGGYAFDKFLGLGILGKNAVANMLDNRAMWTATGELSDAGKQRLASFDIEPEGLSKETLTQVRDMLAKRVDGQEIKRVADAAELPVPVTLTKGQKSLEPDDLRLEAAAFDGNLGPRAREVAKTALGDQQELVQANASAIRQNMGGTGEAVPMAAGGQSAANRITVEAKAARDAAAALRRQAEDGQAFAPSSVLDNVLGQTRQELADLGYTAGTEVGDAVEAKFGRVVENILENRKRGEIPANVILRIRQDIGDAARKASGRESKALGDIAGRIDNEMQGALEQSLITGDEEAVRAWAKSTELWRDYYARYEGKEGARKLIAEIASGKKEPENVSKIIFGATKGVRGGARGLSLTRELKDELGVDSPEWNELRQEAITRLLKGEGLDSERIGTKFASELERALEQDAALMREFFNESELTEMKRFAAVVRNLEAKPQSRGNPSNSGNFLAFFERITPGIARDMMNTLPVIRGVRQGLQEGASARAVEKSMRVTQNQ